ncbi:MAG: anti-sigma factor [Burkholderiales bacterium]|nr:anti-sigma factor [Burkholderiales bacterium]
MNLRDKPELAERLAAEYVLGTLAGGARRRFEGWLSRDAALRQRVAGWEARLSPLAELIAPVQPPARIWDRIAAGIGLRNAAPPRRALWDSLAFWRGLGLAATGVAASLAAFIGLRPPPTVERVKIVERVVEKSVRVADGANPWQPSYVATLKDRDGRTMLMVYVGRRSDELWIKYEGDAMPRDASLELWGLDERGQPKSLGLIRSNGSSTMKLPAMADASIASFKRLAVSMEPVGGSQIGTPTGPVMYQGECHTFW